MDYELLLKKIEEYNNIKGNIDKNTLLSFEKDFDLNFTHHSTAIEGNTLTLLETKVVIEDNVSIGGKELREIYEVINHKNAYDYVKKNIKEEKILDENLIKDLHEIVTKNIIQGGIYRNDEVRISGASFVPPAGNEMYSQIKEFYEKMKTYEMNNIIEFAAWTHAEFVRIHPFIDGNGRTSRLIMNYQLMIHGFLPICIKKEDRLEYYKTLDEYALKGNIKPFTDFIYDLELKEIEKYINLAKN